MCRWRRMTSARPWALWASPMSARVIPNFLIQEFTHYENKLRSPNCANR